MKAQIVAWLVLTLLLGGVVALGWVLSSMILQPQPYSLMPEFEILEASADEVVLPLPSSTRQFANTRQEGVYGLLWEGGHGVLGEGVEEGDSVRRSLSVTAGRPPAAGDEARMDAFVYQRNPLDDHGLAYEALTLQGEAGALQAWWLPQAPRTAVLMLHGRRRGTIQETLRILPTLHALGYSVLALAYRNHGESAPSANGLYTYGASEWQDAATALDFLAEQGIEKVVLYGFSMGGAVALETLKHQFEVQPSLEALVLDSPLLDPRAVFVQGAERMGLPLAGPLTDLALLVARLRTGVTWRELDQRRTAHTVDVPTLLIAGTSDSTVPIEVVDAFAGALPKGEYRRLEGVEHVEGWNRLSASYETWVRAFLLEHVPPD